MVLVTPSSLGTDVDSPSGPTPELKFPTIKSRLNQSNLQPSLLFFRTSSTSRSTQRFLNESRIIPPLLYPTTTHALQSINDTNLEVHYADEEGDPYAVELAGRVGGYVIGNDSDFVILNSEGYLGYIPFEEMLWIPQTSEDDLRAEDDGEFQTVRKAKGKKKPTDSRLNRGIIPPDVTSDLTLSLTFYHPSTLASHVDLPVTLLPLLGALVGNDYSNSALTTQWTTQSLFFQRQLTLTQRISYVASTLCNILATSSQKRGTKHQLGSVMDLMDKAVNALLIRSRSTMGSGEVESIINAVVEATLQYAIPKHDSDSPGLWPTQLCTLHMPDACPLLPLFSHSLTANDIPGTENSKEQHMREKVRVLYIQAYRCGRFPQKMMQILSSGTCWPRIFLENPDLENVGRSVGRTIRQWNYAILEDGVGLPDRIENGKTEQPFNEDGGDDNELVDVVEENSDNEFGKDETDEDALAVLRGELERLRAPADDAAEADRSISSSRSPKRISPKLVVEYVRRGTRIADEEVVVPPLIDLLQSIRILDFDPEDPTPLQLRSEDHRLLILLHALQSNTPLVKSLPREHLLTVLALRWTIHTFDERARLSGGSKDREKERWTKSEALAFLASFPGCSITHDTNNGYEVEDEPPAILDRNIQLFAQMAMSLESIADLVQVLLLVDRVPSHFHAISGERTHLFLTGRRAVSEADVRKKLWEATTTGLEGAFGEEWRKKVKRETKVNASIGSRASVHEHRIHNKVVPAGGLFSLLSDVEA